MTLEILNYKKRMIVKFNYIVNCCILAVVLSTEGYQIIYYFSRLNRLVSFRFVMSRMSIRKISWEQDQIRDTHPRSKHNQRKIKCSERQWSWGVWGVL